MSTRHVDDCACVFCEAEVTFLTAALEYCEAWTRDNRNNFSDGPGRELARTRHRFYVAYRVLRAVSKEPPGSRNQGGGTPK